jgi:hypothetical protein
MFPSKYPKTFYVDMTFFFSHRYLIFVKCALVGVVNVKFSQDERNKQGQNKMYINQLDPLLILSLLN